MNDVTHLRIDEALVIDAKAFPRHKDFSDPHGYIADVNEHLRNLFRRTSDIPRTWAWDVLTPERFRAATTHLSPQARIGAFWWDQCNQALAFAALSAWKAQSLTTSLVRSLNARELIAPSLTARALLELTAATIVQLKEPLGALQTVGKSERPVVFEEAVMDRIEATLVRAIWGTRIGSSELKPGVPLWQENPYESPPTQATNVFTFMQKFAREFEDSGTTALKVYEWLSDIVHPATQGFRLFWESNIEMKPGHTRFSLNAAGADDKRDNLALTLWAAGCSAVILRHTLEHISEAACMTQDALPRVYDLPVPGSMSDSTSR